MYRILIVDDEPFIVDWISGILEDTDRYELEIYRAYSSNEAINILKRAEMNLMLTDISMPVISGLELLKKTKNEWPDCRVIMLTGYSNFDYVYEAMQNGASAYILKIEEDSKILNVVFKELDEIEKHLLTVQKQIENRTITKNTKRNLQQEFFRGVLENSYTDKKEIEMKIDEYGISFDMNQLFIMLLYNVDCNGDTDFDYVNNLVEYFLEDDYIKLYIEYIDKKCIWILQSKDHEYNTQISVQIMSIMEKIEKTIHKNKNINFSCVFCKDAIQFNELPRIMPILESLLMEENKSKKGFIKSCDNPLDVSKLKNKKMILTRNENLKEIVINLRYFERLRISIEGKNKTEFVDLLRVACDKLETVSSLHDNYANEIYLSIILIIMRYINNTNIAEELAFKVDTYKLYNVEYIPFWKDRVKYLYQITDAIFELKDNENKEIDMVWYVQKYIEKNATDDVSLIKLSEVTGYNPTYISRVFKEQKGITISKYTSDIKKRIVLDLLNSKKYSLNEIAMKSGFNSRQYFNRFIKKKFGMTPDQLVKSRLL